MYPPLSEITSEHNITFPYEDIKYIDFQEGIEYEFHIYNIGELANAILEGIDLIENDRDKYNEIRNKLVEHAKKFDIMVTYPKLLSLLK